jgi:protein-disulfide isomerase
MAKRVLAVTAFFVFVLTGSMDSRAKDFALNEHAYGKKDAPVTMDEYQSLTCSHCADFTATVLPELEKRYVETGKMRIVFNDFPIDGHSLKASALAHCMPEDQFHPFVKVVFKNLKQWVFSKSPEDTLIQYAKLGGLDETKARACLKDPNILDALVARRAQAMEKHEINSTPTFIFNGGAEKLVGMRKLEEFTAVIDKLLAEKK